MIEEGAMKLLRLRWQSVLELLAPRRGHWRAGCGGDERHRSQPEARGAILTNMILAIAFAEAIAIYALVVAIVLIFVA